MLIYHKILKQKNAFLRDFKQQSFNGELLDVFDEKLSNYGSLIIKERKKYIEVLRECACEFYLGISDNREKITVNYSQFGLNDIKDETLKIIYNDKFNTSISKLELFN